MVGRDVGLHRSNVGRHRRRHLLPAVAGQFAEAAGEFDLAAEMRRLYAKVMRHLEAADQSSNVVVLRALAAEARAGVETLLKLQLAAAATAPRGPVTLSLDLSLNDDGVPARLPSRSEDLAALSGGNDKDDDDNALNDNEADGGGWIVV